MVESETRFFTPVTDVSNKSRSNLQLQGTIQKMNEGNNNSKVSHIKQVRLLDRVCIKFKQKFNRIISALS